MAFMLLQDPVLVGAMLTQFSSVAPAGLMLGPPVGLVEWLPSHTHKDLLVT